jgi:DNA-binding GntR family transcriptional regulator
MLLRDSIYRAIRHAILTGEFQPGQELREQVLAERYRVSRSPVRDSLLRLELENLVTVLPRQGYRVNSISIPDVENLFELRLLIEPACAAAAARADDAALQALDRFRGYTKARMETEFIEYNSSFHRAIVDLSGNTRMVKVARDLAEQFERLVRLSLRASNSEYVHDALSEHEAIIDALQAHDGERASRLASEHLARAHARILKALQSVAPWKEPAEPLIPVE